MTFSVLYRLWPLLVIILLFFLLYYFGINQYLSYASLQQHHQKLISWTNQHYIYAAGLYMLFYIICVAVSFPGALILTLTGGLLFGLWWGVLFVVISATLGSTLIFLIVKFALNDWITKKTAGWVSKMRKGFQDNAFSYLLILRLIPLFPFWAVNIVPALLGVKAQIFILATFLGIIPGSMIYVSIGNGLNHLFEKGQAPDLKMILTPPILWPLLALALLSLMPILYKKFKDHNE